MKKIITIVAALFLATSGSMAQLLTESFDYSAGDSLTSHGWTSFSGGVTNAIDVTSPGLSFPGYQLPGIGNTARLRNTGQDVYKAHLSNVSAGSLYAFFIVNVDTARIVAGGGDYFFGFLPSTSTTNYTCRVYIRKSVTLTDKFAFGITKNAISGGAVVWSDSVYSIGVDYLVGAKYTFLSGSTTDDQVSLFVFSSAPPLIEPGVPVLGPVTGTTTDVTDIGRFALRQGLATTSPTMRVDEIYVGTDWGTVLPVELTSFTHSVSGRNVTLKWSTSGEIGNAGFQVEKRNSEATEWNNAGFVEGRGTTSVPEQYDFVDRNVSPGRFEYRLKQIDYNGNFEYHELGTSVIVGAPGNYSLHQNFPNPFNPSTKINFDLPADGYVSLRVFDISGRQVMQVVNGFMLSGYHTAEVNASGLPSGAYFYRIEAGSFSAVKRMLLVK